MGKQLIMLTGDHQTTPLKLFAARVGMDDVIAESCLPKKKTSSRTSWQKGNVVAHSVGDGMSPPRPFGARADVGIAIGAGTDVAPQAAT